MDKDKTRKARLAKMWNQRQRISVLLAGTKAFGEHPESQGVETMTMQLMEIIYGQDVDDQQDDQKKFDCYEIWRPNIPADGCKEQCKECAAKSAALKQK